MNIVQCPQSFFGKPRPWVVAAHLYEADRQELYDVASTSNLTGTVLDVVPMGEHLGSKEECYEWRLVAMNEADMILMSLDGIGDSMTEFGIYAPRGNVILVGDLPEFPPHYYQLLIRQFSVPRINKSKQVIDLLEQQLEEE